MPVNSSRGAIAVKALGFTNGSASDYYYIAKVTNIAGSLYNGIIALGYQNGTFLVNYGVVSATDQRSIANQFDRTMNVITASRTYYDVPNVPSFFGLERPAVASDTSGNMYFYSAGFLNKQSAAGAGWAYTFDVSGSPSSSSWRSGVGVSSAGDVYISSRINISSYNRHVIQKINSSGTVQYAKRVDVASQPIVYSTGIKLAGNYISFAGGYINKLFVALTDLDVTVSFCKEVSTSLQLAEAVNGSDTVCDSAGNTYFVYAVSSGGSSTSSVLRAVKFNSSGTVQWNKEYDVPAGMRYTSAALTGGYLWIVTTVYSTGTTYLLKVLGDDGSVTLSRSISHPTDTDDSSNAINVTNTSVQVSLEPIFLTLRLPVTGVGTGSYTVGGTSVTYSTASIAASTVSDSFSTAATTVTSETTSNSSVTTRSATSLTVAVTQV